VAVALIPMDKKEIMVGGPAKPPQRVVDWMLFASDQLKWEAVYFRIHNTALGGCIQADHWVIVLTPQDSIISEFVMPTEPLTGVQSIQGCLDPTSSPIEDYIWPRDLQNL